MLLERMRASAERWTGPFWVRSVVAWALAGGLVVGVYCASMETAIVHAPEVPLVDLVVAALMAASYSFGLAVLLSPLLAALASLHRWRGDSGWAWRAVVGAAVALAGTASAWLLIDPLRRRMVWVYRAIAIAAGVLAAVLAELGRLKPERNRVIAAALVLAGAVAADLLLPPTLYIELHDLLLLVGAGACLVVVSPLRQRLERPGGGSLVGLVVSVVAALALGAVVDAARPGWRAVSFSRGRVAVRVARVFGSLPGFGPDEGRLVPPPRGGEADEIGCPPEGADLERRGLVAGFGSPHLPPGEVNLTLLVTIDTLREDAFTAELMPNLTRLARRGMRFNRGYSAGTGTLTSLHLVHQAHPSSPFVAERLAAAGVVLTSVMGIPELRPDRYGFPVELSASRATELTDLAIGRIKDVGREPHFIWVHYMDVHHAFAPEDVDVPEKAGIVPGKYRRAVAYVDRELGRLLELIEREGRLEKAAILVTSDHGEAFGEHGVNYHNSGGIEEVMRVPAVLVAPRIPAGSYGQLTTTRDTPATLLGAFGFEEEARRAECFGRSLFRLAGTQGALHSFIHVRSARYASGAETDDPLGVIVDSRYKLVHSYADDHSWLFDLRADPSEDDEMAARGGDVVIEMERRLERFCAAGGC